MDRSGELPTAPSEYEDKRLGGVFTLLVTQGPEAGQTLTLNTASPARVLVGKSPVCTLRLTDPEVSRRHASLRAQDKALVLMDLGSTNQTFVNSVSVREVYLRGGESIRMGSTVITVTPGTPSYVSLVQDASFGRMLGESRAMRAIYPMLHSAVRGDFPILLEGEGGVGKRLCAEEIHRRSKRADQRFVSVACRSIGVDEIEERLFGQRGGEGAGGEAAASGLVHEAAGGTIFLDEVTALPDKLQQRLLAAMTPSADEPRLIFGTRQDLDREVTNGRFREDLLAALAAARIEIPPLRERGGDVEMLAKSFWAGLVAEAADAVADDEPAELPNDFMARAQDYTWPGNVRELSRAVCTRFCLGEFGRWRADGVQKVADDSFHAVLGRELRLAEARDVVVEEFERRYVQYMLDRHGTTKDAAKASGVAQRYFQLLRARSRSAKAPTD